MRLFVFRAVRLGGFLLIGLLLFTGFTCWRRSAGSPTQVPLLPALPQDPQIQAYFNHSQAAVYTEPYRQQYRLGDDLEQVVIDAVATAQTSVDVAVHELNLPRIAAALKERHQAGVPVRVIVENTYRRPMSQLTAQEVQQLDQRGQKKYQDFVLLVDENQNGRLEPNEIAVRDAIAILQDAGVPLIDDTADGSKGSDLMHHKFIVVDGHTVISGSANFTWSDIHGDFSVVESQGNANHLLKIVSPAVAGLYEQEFNLMWGKGTKTTSQFGLKKAYRPAQTVKLAPNSQITVQFSPTSTRLPWQQTVNGLIGRSLNQSTHSIDLALFVFSEQQLSNVLETNQRKGIQIRALIDPSFAYRDYSEALDLMGVSLANNRCRYEADNHPWSQPIATVGIPQLPVGDLLHHKFGVIDQHIVISGSQNWSDAANRSNDENLLVINNSTVAAHFQREFDRLYSGAILGVSATVQERLEQQQKRCGI